MISRLYSKPLYSSSANNLKGSTMDLPRIRPTPRHLSRSWQDDEQGLEEAKAIVAHPLVRSRMPQFVHVGPTRTATTWVWQILKDHADVSREYKEIFFFAQNFIRGFDWYLAHFGPLMPGLPRIDIEPEYFPGKAARHRIGYLIPGAKIICCLREPVERLFSFYKILVRSTSMPPYSFEQACERDWRLAESARYGTHLRAWLDAFGKDNVLVLFYEDLLQDPQVFANRICDFMCIERFTLTADLLRRVYSSECFTAPRSRMWANLGRVVGLRMWELGSPRLNHLVRSLKLSTLFYDTGAPFVQPDPAVVARIKARLRPEIQMVESLTGRDLSAWKDVAGHSNKRHGHPAITEQVLVPNPGAE